MLHFTSISQEYNVFFLYQFGDTDILFRIQQVTFELDNDKINYNSSKVRSQWEGSGGEGGSGAESADGGGSDLGFEEGEADECACAACRRLAAWDELVAVALPLIDRMRPARHDAAVGTD